MKLLGMVTHVTIVEVMFIFFCSASAYIIFKSGSQC
jgi:hypothetical protein